VAKLLIADGANVKAYDGTPLAAAAAAGSVEIARALLAAGADVHAADDSALMGAMTHGRVEVRWDAHSTGSAV
jgi:ankyrin repeat protein